MLNTEMLSLFKLVYQKHSLKEAAALHPMSLSKASRVLRDLRDEFADELFVRSGNELFPTPRATKLFPSVEKLLADFDAITESPTFDPKRAHCLFNIACLDLDLIAHVAPIQEELRELAPGIRLNFHPIDRNFIDRLHEGRCDFVFYPTSLDYPGIGRQAFCQDTFVYVCQPDNPLAERVRKGEILSEREVVEKLTAQVTTPIRNRDNTRFGLYEHDVESSRFSPQLWTPFFATLPFLLTADSTTFLPLQAYARLKDRLPLTVLGRPANLVPYESCLLWESRNEKNPLHQWFRAFVISRLREIAAEPENFSVLTP